MTTPRTQHTPQALQADEQSCFRVLEDGSSERSFLGARLQRLACGRVLDLASGDGRFLRLIAEVCGSYSQLTAADPAKAALDEARRAELPSRVRFVRTAGEALPFADCALDTVTIADGLHHLRDSRRVLRELRRVARPGGLIIISEVLRRPESPATATAIRLHHFKARTDRRLGLPHHRTLAARELAAMISTVFRDDETESVIVPAVEECVEERELELQRSGFHRERLRSYLSPLRGDPRYAVLRAVAETLAGRVESTGYTEAARGIILVRKQPSGG